MATGGAGYTGYLPPSIGYTGATGYVGVTGTINKFASSNFYGAVNIKDYMGSTGTTGYYVKVPASFGMTGNAVINGNLTVNGILNAPNFVGITGARGATGSTGIQGLQGFTGATGSQGLQGFTGQKGDTGSQGIQGVTGQKGDTGSQGLPGTSGASILPLNNTFTGTNTFNNTINTSSIITRTTALTTANDNDYITKSYQKSNNSISDMNGLSLANLTLPLLMGNNTGTLGGPFNSQLICDSPNLSYNPSTRLLTCHATSCYNIEGDQTFTLGAIPYKKTNTVTGWVSAGTTGQYLVCQGTSAPQWSTLSLTTGPQGSTGSQGPQGVTGQKGDTGSQGIPGNPGTDGTSILPLNNTFTGTNTFTGSGINITNGAGVGVNIKQTNTAPQPIQWLNSGGSALANIYVTTLGSVLAFDITSLLTNGIRFTQGITNLMTLSTTGLMTLLTSPAFSYTTLPTLSSSQLGYSVPITVNSPGSNSAGNAYYLLATITNMPIGVFTIFYTVYTNATGAGIKIGLSTSSNTSTNTYLNFTDLIAGGMSSYYYVFSNTSVRTIYIMGFAGFPITFSTNYGNNSASCVRIA